MNTLRSAKIFLILALLCIPIMAYASWWSKAFERGIDAQEDDYVVIVGDTGKGLKVGTNGTGASTVYYKEISIGTGNTSGTVTCTGIDADDLCTGAVFLSANASSAAVLYVKPEANAVDAVISAAAPTTLTLGVTVIQTP